MLVDGMLCSLQLVPGGQPAGWQVCSWLSYFQDAGRGIFPSLISSLLQLCPKSLL